MRTFSVFTTILLTTTTKTATTLAYLRRFHFLGTTTRIRHNNVWDNRHSRRWASDNNSKEVTTTNTDDIGGTRKNNPLAGMPIGPVLATSSNKNSSTMMITLRYMYEGGILGQGRICHIHLSDNNNNNDNNQNQRTITVSEIYQTLQTDGVDLDTFYACAYEPNEGGWMPLESGLRYKNSISNHDEPKNDAGPQRIVFPVPKDSTTISKRIDIQLFRRPKIPPIESSFDSIDQLSSTVEHSSVALRAISASVPVGKLSREEGYCGIGIFQPKVAPNIGTLWRSAYQLGASILYTIGGRQSANNAADTLDVPTRIPMIQLKDWTAFAEWAAPKGAVWVAVEMGGTPLADYEHPRNAIYILGSEDNGVPKSVVRACRDVVSLESERYGSYNVAVAGSIVLYDRMMKLKETKKQQGTTVVS